MKPSKPFVIAVTVISVLSWAVFDYLTLPAYNVQSFGFWVLAGVYLSVIGFVVGLASGKGKRAVAGGLLGPVAILVAIVLSIGSWTFFPGNDARYASLLRLEERSKEDFLSDFSAARGVSLVLPTVDKEISIKTAQGKMGQYGAQYSMSEEVFTAVTSIRSGKLSVSRVTPLDYSGTFVALSSGAKGTVGYIEVDQVTGDGRLVEVPGGMKFTPGAVLSHDLMRHVRFAHRTALLGDYSFEIDDEGKPFWIVHVLSNKVGLFGGATSDGIITVDPVSGAMARYALGEEPAWVDRVVPTGVILSQANDALSLSGGWINAVFGEKRGVFQLSDGYNYQFSFDSSNATTWFVSGITSPNEADQTLAGFLLVNAKTGAARKYAVDGITEMRAMEIAENDERVRAQTLGATWPILTEIGGEPAYFMFLKNQVQRQRFVYVDAATGARVAMGDTVERTVSEFARLSGSKAASTEPAESVVGTVLRVRHGSQDGSVSFLLEGDPGNLYSVDSAATNGMRFLEVGDKVEVKYRESSASPGRRFVVEAKNLTVGE